MKKTLFLFLCILAITFAAAEDKSKPKEGKQKTLNNDNNLLIGGYGQVDYNQELNSDTKNNGELDVHRLVVLLGYRFNSRLQLITEIEFEHVKEVFVEQAYIQYKMNDYLNFKGGLLLIPMGIINEYHEPPTFNGVERPLIDKNIAPTTWREIGLGITGNLTSISLKYQVYIVNGFCSFDENIKLSGKSGLRAGRQKGAKSIISSPNFAGRLEFYGIKGLKTGFSTYFGNTQTSFNENINKDDNQAISKADSSVIGVSMLGFDIRYNLRGFELRGQFYHTSLSNTREYNYFTASNRTLNDMGSSMIGYYLETAYNVFKASKKVKSELIPFFRYEKYNTHHSVHKNFDKNRKYENTVLTAGLSWKIIPEVAVKADFQFLKSAADKHYAKTFNAGIAFMF